MKAQRVIDYRFNLTNHHAGNEINEEDFYDSYTFISMTHPPFTLPLILLIKPCFE